MKTEAQKHFNISVTKKNPLNRLTKFCFCCLVSIGTVKKVKFQRVKPKGRVLSQFKSPFALADSHPLPKQSPSQQKQVTE